MEEITTSRLVLLVEDDLTTQEMVSSLLKRLDLAPAIASSAQQARSLLNEKFYDLVLMDINLPDSSGLELCAELRLKEKTTNKHTYVVALTGMNGPEDRKRCLDGGMDGYFSKPIDRLKLQSFVKKSPEDDRVPQALLTIGSAQINSGQKAAGMATLKQLMQNHPSNPAAQTAEKIISGS